MPGPTPQSVGHGAPVPSDYVQGYARARAVHPELADRYIRHVDVGDPAADAVVEALQDHPEARRTAWIRGGIDGGADAIPDAPAEVRDFFASLEDVPEWWDGERALAGCRGFHRHSEAFLAAFVGSVLIEGFATTISRSFSITGRIVDQGVRRLKQNNRHLIEIFMPGGLERQGDGWKLSVRIRLVHATVRRLLDDAGEWDPAAWGRPLSAANVAYAAAAFSGLLLKRARSLGATLPDDEREAFIMIWRYSALLMGVVPELLFVDEEDALRLHAVATMCEPPPGIEACQMANALINAAPIVAGVTDEEERRRTSRVIYRASRALIGDELADALGYPPSQTLGVLALIRWRNRLDRTLDALAPSAARRRRAGRFERMLGLSHYDRDGIGYRMPDHVHAEEDRPL